MGETSRGQPSLQHSTDLGFMSERPDGSLSSVEEGKKKHLKYSSLWEARFSGLTVSIHPDRAREDLLRRKIPKSRRAKLVTSYPRRLEAVIAAKGASTKYWVKGLNTYVDVISVFPF